MNKSRLISIAVIVVLLAVAAGYFVGKRGNAMNNADISTSGATTEGRKVLYWKAPMDPNFYSDKPGKSPMGMALVPVYANDGGTGNASDVKISPDVVNNLGVRTALVQQGSLSHRLVTVGYVGYDEDTITSINTRADGWVEKLAVKSVGAQVRAGQLLYELFSPKLATAEREYLTTLSSGSQSLIAASAERMRSLGDLHTVWVMAEVDESNAGLLHTGQKVITEFDAFPGRQWQGVIDYIYPNLSSMTRTVKVRLRFANPDLRLQPNMYARVAIHAEPQRTGIYIPNQALIRTGQSQRVIVALGDGRFDVCPVQAGFSSGDRVEILKGLQPGQRVVTSAQFMIDSEANVGAAALRLGAGRVGCHESPPNPDDKEKTQAGASMFGMDMSGKVLPTVSVKSKQGKRSSKAQLIRPAHP